MSQSAKLQEEEIKLSLTLKRPPLIIGGTSTFTTEKGGGEGYMLHAITACVFATLTYNKHSGSIPITGMAQGDKLFLTNITAVEVGTGEEMAVYTL